MKTVIAGKEGIAEAGEIIRHGGLVSFPTETVYGLGGNALDPKASEKIYSAKGRPSDNPLIVHVFCKEDVDALVKSVTADAEILMESFWPGPLTIVLPKAECVPYETTGGLETVAVRCPDNRMTLQFIKEAGVPIAGPSANLSGKPSPTKAEHVYHDLNGRIEMILDDGPVGIGVESTIIDLTGDQPMLLRPGAITKEALEICLQKPVLIDPAILAGGMAADVRPRAPGMKYRHYAPNAPMILVSTARLKNRGTSLTETEIAEEDRKTAAYISCEARKETDNGKRVGIICCSETAELYNGNLPGMRICVMGSRKDMLTMTRNLFGILRDFDEDGTDKIYAESFSETGVGFALMNRMKKAAGMTEILI